MSNKNNGSALNSDDSVGAEYAYRMADAMLKAMDCDS